MIVSSGTDIIELNIQNNRILLEFYDYTIILNIHQFEKFIQKLICT